MRAEREKGSRNAIEFTCGVAGQIGGAVQDEAGRTMEHGRVAQTTALNAGGHVRVGHLQWRTVNSYKHNCEDEKGSIIKSLKLIKNIKEHANIFKDFQLFFFFNQVYCIETFLIFA